MGIMAMYVSVFWMYGGSACNHSFYYLMDICSLSSGWWLMPLANSLVLLKCKGTTLLGRPTSWCLLKSQCSVMTNCTEVRFACFLSGGFTNMAVINPPEKKMANAPLCSGGEGTKICQNWWWIVVKN